MAIGDDIAGVQGVANFLKGVAIPAAQRLIGLGGEEERSNEHVPEPGQEFEITLGGEREGIETNV